MPVFTDSVTTRGVTTKGVYVPVGTSKDDRARSLQRRSDGRPVDARARKAYTRGGAAPVTISFDKTRGRTATRSTLTVTSTAAITEQEQDRDARHHVDAAAARQNLWIGILGQQ